MKYIRVYNESSSPVVLKGLTRTYVIDGRDGHNPMIEDIPEDDVHYINGRCDVFRTGRLHFDESEVESIMEKLRNPNWRKQLMSDDDIYAVILNPTAENLRLITKCMTRPEIERYRSAMVSLQNANRGVSDVMSRVVRERFAELANGVLASRIVLPDDAVLNRNNAQHDIEAMKNENEAMRTQMAEMQKQLEALLAAQAPAKEKTKTTRAKAPKTEPTAE